MQPVQIGIKIRSITCNTKVAAGQTHMLQKSCLYAIPNTHITHTLTPLCRIFINASSGIRTRDRIVPAVQDHRSYTVIMIDYE
jgi:hypothetical protein